MEQTQPSWRPAAGGPISLSDAQLAHIGLMVVFEAGAKAVTATALKVVEGLSIDQWVRLERVQLSQIMTRLVTAVAQGDQELVDRVTVLEQARLSAHELRHIVVHVVWGQAPGPEALPTAHDFGRRRSLCADDINSALEGCAELKRAATRVAYRIAELVEQGVYPEREAGLPGMGIRTQNRLVRL